MFSPHFLVVSLGNPAPYLDTLHSAGHIVLDALQQQLRDAQPPFASERRGKKSCQTSNGPKYTLVKSPTLMNVCGPWLAKTWKETLADQNLTPEELGLVLVHDDLEEDLGVVKIRKWDRSHRGHNGVKSVNASLRGADYKGARWARISVGIGRPGERDRSTVSDYVLRRTTQRERSVLAEQGCTGVLERLLELEAQWEQDVKQKQRLEEGQPRL
ncbi:uncharacterized protein E0L32_006701 [Thyridium curvatum]|uniref:peptidyl-tRNA hydrolase n=1 Tax=Thyridium curvatum TaxID=1093900 RepID=A0A507B6Z1_9PEZI|nr:uncharacterized protein E0L32_006701 [Thyridium curvatum]TPX12821.1 hypothetical protein E0L32_006701 [Thyridium curvatum]